MKRSKSSPVRWLAGTLTLCAGIGVQAQGPLFGLPPRLGVPESRGLLNDWVIKNNPELTTIDLGGQFRSRYEYFNNGPSFEFPSLDFQRTGAANDNAYLLFREKLHFGWHNAGFGFYVEGEDSSSTGDHHSKNPGADQYDLHQAYITLGNMADFPLQLKVGRQELTYGDERLVGTSDWSNVDRVFDGFKLHFEKPDYWLDVFTSRVVLVDNHNFNQPNDYDWFSGIYATTRTLLPFQETQAYLFARNTAPGSPTAHAGGSPEAGGPSSRDIYTSGVRVKTIPGKLGGWDYTVEVAQQYGSVNLPVPGGTPRRVKQEAMAMSIAAGYSWTKSFGSPRLGLEYDFSTGDKDPTDGTSGTFDNLFPTNHKHYGMMDFTGWRNIHDLRLTGSLKPTKTITATADFHLFRLDDDRDFFYPQSGAGRSASGYGRNSQYSKYLGSEVDIDVTWNLARYASIRGGYGHFFAGDYLKESKAALGGATDADWIFAQITFNF